MFYEETMIDGAWYWRGTPTGDWVPMGSARLTEKIAALTAKVAELESLLGEARKVLDDHWFTSNGEDEFNNDDVIEMSHKIKAALTPAAGRAVGPRDGHRT